VTERDIAIIACERRPTPADTSRVIGVRWAARPDLGFPLRGYIVRRREVASPGSVTIGIFTLPNTTDWTAFRADVIARRPLRGPYFSTIESENLEYLLPIVRLADPRTSDLEIGPLTEKVAEFFGNIHVDDAELAWYLWPTGSPPPLTQLLADAVSGLRLRQFYRRRASDYLAALAMRFEFAVLFGLATDDAAPPTTVVYELDAVWREERGIAQSDVHHTNELCVVSPPSWLVAERTPGSVSHPAFAAWPDWSPPAGFVPVDAEGVPAVPETLVPRSPAAFTALTWTPPPPEPAVIGHGPVLYRIARFDHGRDTAASMTPPALPAGTVFSPLLDGEDLLRSSSEPNFLDLPGMSWPPLEGHYRYRINAVNLLGVVSDDDTEATVRHHDDFAPAAPRVRVLAGPGVTPGPDGNVVVPLRVTWDASEDFAGPDVAEFRISVAWKALSATTLQLTTVAPAGPLHVDLTIAHVPADVDSLKGARLSMPNGEFPIVSHGSGASAAMRVRRVAGRSPEPGAYGVVLVLGSATPWTRVRRLERHPAVPATIDSVDSIAPLVAVLAPAAGVPVPATGRARIYLHVFRATFDAEPAVDGRWLIAPPQAGSPVKPDWDRWAAAPDPRSLLASSPAIVFPEHEIEVRVSPPPGFTAGILEISCVAADATPYVASPSMPALDASLIGLRGNESTPAVVALSVRDTREPSEPVVGAWQPGQRLWATSAAIYQEAAEFPVTWSATVGAVRYEVWRALDEGLPGAASAADDQARRQIASQHPEAFELRSGQAFGTAYRDALPGRAPTRAYYRVRAVGLNGVAGAMSGVIGPVYVPDVRRPPPPNVLRVNAVAPDKHDRAISIEWIQPGDLTGVHFDVEYSDGNGATAPYVLAGRVPGTSPVGASTFRLVHDGRTPGKTYRYRVIAYREVADPVDPAGIATRKIASAPSEARSAVALSLTTIEPPSGVAAVVGPNGAVSVTWSNRDAYEAITIRRRDPDARVYRFVAKVAGDFVSYSEPNVPAGTWLYQVRAHGVSRMANSEDIEVEVP